MEEYVLSFALNWKLIYTTPFDVIQTLVHKVSFGNSKSREDMKIIGKKAIQISELLLIWHNTLDSHSVLSIALASLRSALQLLNAESLLHHVDEFINEENKNEVGNLLEYLREELSPQPKEAITQDNTPEDLNEDSSPAPGKRLQSEGEDVEKLSERLNKRFINA
eukprot:TRINITY_DN7000_c0_g1_i11.p1 TRINITY_DN7000_c0_g1~~TRINITY_DN7000_c0_g1_i11.p1  ORF type:complete len:165 (+),score=44.30 TRINITY_DN7000_c0_g1_i11:611-1105(+)